MGGAFLPLVFRSYSCFISWPSVVLFCLTCCRCQWIKHSSERGGMVRPVNGSGGCVDVLVWRSAAACHILNGPTVKPACSVWASADHMFFWKVQILSFVRVQAMAPRVSFSNWNFQDISSASIASGQTTAVVSTATCCCLDRSSNGTFPVVDVEPGCGMWEESPIPCLQGARIHKSPNPC